VSAGFVQTAPTPQSSLTHAVTQLLPNCLPRFLSEVGVVSAEDQRKELGLTTPAEEASPSTADTAPDAKKTD
jgi:hypothetical protein